MIKYQLERIKDMYSGISDPDRLDGIPVVTVAQSDIEWLIEQAERAQELEEELYGNDIQMGYKRMYEACNRDYAKLLQQNKRYREAINNIIEKAMLFGTNEEVYEAIQDAIKALEGKK